VNTDFKACADCNHCLKSFRFPESWLCGKAIRGRSVVSGHFEYDECLNQRGKLGDCKESGLNFEPKPAPKPTFFQRLLGAKGGAK
jgi:hypothetical protein